MALQTFAEFKNSNNTSVNTGGTSSGLKSFSEFKKTYKPKVKEPGMLSNIKDVVKELPGAAKQVFTEPFKHPIDTLKALVTGVADVGVGAVNITNKIMGTPQLPYLSQAFNETIKDQKQKDVLSSISEGAKQYAGFELGQKAVGSAGISNPILRGILGNVAGGQLVADPNSTLKERGNQALFDAAFGAVTEGTSPLLKKVFKKETPLVEQGIQKEIKPIVNNLSDEKVARDLHSWTTGLSKNGELPKDTISKLKTNKIGVDELPVNSDGTITLFRNGEIKPGKTQSYSSQRIDPNQIEVKVPKENVLVNLNSSKIDELYNKSFTKQEIDAGYLEQRKLNKFEKEVVATSPNIQNNVVNKIEPSIGNKPSIESSRINENLVKQGFDELPPEQKANYNAFQVKEQTDKITNHLNTNYEGFKQSVLDNKIPSDIQPTMAFNAVKNKAIQEGDFETQRLLAKSPLASLSSQAGSTLRATQEFSIDGADSVGIMNKVNKELEKTVEKKLGKPISQAKQELVNNAEQIFKSEVKKITSKQSVADFINSIPDC